MDNTYTTITLSNECYLYKVRLENGRLWLTGDGRGWWRAGDVTPATPLETLSDVIISVTHTMRLRTTPAEVAVVLNQLLSARHLRRLPLGAEYRYTITYTNGGGLTVKRKNISARKGR